MGEGHIATYTKSVQAVIAGWVSALGLALIAGETIIHLKIEVNELFIASIFAVVWLIVAIISGLIIGHQVVKPTVYLAQAILNISPNQHLVAAPNLDDLRLGHELIANLVRQVYDFATVSQQLSPKSSNSMPALLDQFPVAVIGLDEQRTITMANHKATELLKNEVLAGKPLDSTLTLITEEEPTIEEWLKEASDKSLTADRTWQKVEVKTNDSQPIGYFDIAVSYSKHSASGIETTIALYDHTDVYDAEQSSIDFVALAVHELRSPLTIMRGYIEAFEDELGTNVTPQIKDDLRKMNASAENLTAFVSKILSVARVDQGQLVLNLQEDNWNNALPQAVDNLRNRAAVYGKTIELRMQPKLPTVAIDRITIGEVVTNLIENAVKYTPQSPAKITMISRLNKDGFIETTVQDPGVGITSSVMPHLFNKFQRNHRNRTQIGGTGLGLYMSKAIVNAHHGNIWVSSKEGEGSTFGFTLLPFSQLAKDQQNPNNEAIIRSSHGWIKNHSMQRR